MSLVPLLVTTFTIAPENRPYSALNELVSSGIPRSSQRRDDRGAIVHAFFDVAAVDHKELPIHVARSPKPGRRFRSGNESVMLRSVG